MTTALIYLAVLLFVAATVYVLAAVVFGRGEELGPLPPGATPTRLPESDVTGGDVRVLRFQQTVRGYRTAEVDWALGRLADEIDLLRARVVELEDRGNPNIAARSEFATWFANAAPRSGNKHVRADDPGDTATMPVPAADRSGAVTPAISDEVTPVWVPDVAPGTAEDVRPWEAAPADVDSRAVNAVDRDPLDVRPTDVEPADVEPGDADGDRTVPTPPAVADDRGAGASAATPSGAVNGRPDGGPADPVGGTVDGPTPGPVGDEPPGSGTSGR